MYHQGYPLKGPLCVPKYIEEVHQLTAPRLSPLPNTFHTQREVYRDLVLGKKIWGPKFIFMAGIFAMFPK